MKLRKHQIIHGSVIAIAGFGISQALRLGSQLVLTRLLFPEAFALSAIIGAIFTGLGMLSDVGFKTAVVTHREDIDQSLLDSVWSLQLLRSIALALLACILALPAAYFYDQPLLGPMLCVASIALIANGLASPQLYVATREVRVARLLTIELASQLVAIAAMISWSLFQPSAWALVAGTIASAIVRTIASFLAFPQYRPRWHIHRQRVRDLISFSRWLTLSTALVYLGGHGHRLILGKVFPLELFGAFTIAAQITGVLDQCRNMIGERILVPVLTEAMSADESTQIRRVGKSRLSSFLLLLPAGCLFMTWGDALVDALFDERYAAAGPMVQILSIGCLFGSLGNFGPALLAERNSRRYLKLIASQTFLTTTLLLLATLHPSHYAILWALVLARAIQYPIECLTARRYSIWLPRVELTGVATAVGLSALLLLARHML